MNRIKATLWLILATLLGACAHVRSETLTTSEAPGHTHTIELTATTAPTAKELSQPGALQRHIDESYKKHHHVVLPPGRITHDPIRFVRMHDAEIVGHGTTLVCSDPLAEKSITQAMTGNLTFRGITFEHAGPVTWSQEHWHGDGTLGTRFVGCTWRKVGAKREGVGLRLARTKAEPTCADVEITFCTFEGYDSALETNGNQVVRVHVGNTTEILHCNRALKLNHGGHVYLDKVGVIGLKEIVRFGPDAKGSSLQPAVTMRDVYTDDAGGMTRIVDMSEAPDYWQVIVLDGVDCNIPDGKGEGFDLIVGPRDGLKRVKFDVRSLTKTGKANTEPAAPSKSGGD